MPAPFTKEYQIRENFRKAFPKSQFQFSAGSPAAAVAKPAAAKLAAAPAPRPAVAVQPIIPVVATAAQRQQAFRGIVVRAVTATDADYLKADKCLASVAKGLAELRPGDTEGDFGAFVFSVRHAVTGGQSGAPFAEMRGIANLRAALKMESQPPAWKREELAVLGQSRQLSGEAAAKFNRENSHTLERARHAELAANLFQK